MPAGFHTGSSTLQDRFGTQVLAARIDSLLVTDTINDGDRLFIEQRDMLLLATTDADGRPTCSYKGGEPGLRSRGQELRDRRVLGEVDGRTGLRRGFFGQMAAAGDVPVVGASPGYRHANAHPCHAGTGRATDGAAYRNRTDDLRITSWFEGVIGGGGE